MRWIPFIIFLIVLEWYAFQALKTAVQNKGWWVFYILTVFSILGIFMWELYTYDRSVGWTPFIAYTVGFFVALITGQLVIICLLFFENSQNTKCKSATTHHFSRFQQKRISP